MHPQASTAGRIVPTVSTLSSRERGYPMIATAADLVPVRGSIVNPMRLKGEPSPMR